MIPSISGEDLDRLRDGGGSQEQLQGCRHGMIRYAPSTSPVRLSPVINACAAN